MPELAVHSADNPEISFIIPFYNEQPNVDFVLGELLQESWTKTRAIEFILVNDGSEDDTLPMLLNWREKDERIVVLDLGKPHKGKSTALLAGFEVAKGKNIFLMDGDGQNVPADYEKIIALLEEYDSVAGYRAKRAAGLQRKIMSKIGNGFRKAVLKTPIRDGACIVMGFRRELLKFIPSVKGMHRFIQTIFYRAGVKLTQIPVSERPRRAGKAKYGLNRILKTYADLKGFRWFLKRLIKDKPFEIYRQNRVRES